MIELTDTHCHIHEAVRRTTPVYDKWHANGEVDIEKVLADASAVGVNNLICVGTTLDDSQLAIEFVKSRENSPITSSDQQKLFASIGIHPHEASEHLVRARTLTSFAALAHDVKKDNIVAVGECGLDYFYEHSSRQDQQKVLRFQIELALATDLPLIFHVREAFDDFWPIFEEYRGIRGVLHSFTDSAANLERALSHGLSIGVNGIATFTKDTAQLDVYRSIPTQNLILETDAPFLTPAPYRGKVCEPKHVLVTAEFLSQLRGEDLADLAAATTKNARRLFNL